MDDKHEPIRERIYDAERARLAAAVDRHDETHDKSLLTLSASGIAVNAAAAATLGASESLPIVLLCLAWLSLGYAVHACLLTMKIAGDDAATTLRHLDHEFSRGTPDFANVARDRTLEVHSNANDRSDDLNARGAWAFRIGVVLTLACVVVA